MPTSLIDNMDVKTYTRSLGHRIFAIIIITTTITGYVHVCMSLRDRKQCSDVCSVKSWLLCQLTYIIVFSYQLHHVCSASVQ